MTDVIPLAMNKVVKTLVIARIGTIFLTAVFLSLPRAGHSADELLTKALKCSNFDDCLNVMLQAAEPRKPEALNVAAARIGELPKPRKGNRKTARDLNSKGLSEFRKGNIAEAVSLLQQAVNEDPSDVEVQANLGFLLLKANRAQDAKEPLRNALTINPRRTSNWMPMADLFFEIGDSDKALSALLLGYEFSENKEKARAYFEGKSGAADRNANTYALALKRVNEPRSTVQPGAIDAATTNEGQTISKSQAKVFLTEKVNSDADLRKNPVAKEIFLCTLNGLLDQAFRGARELDMTTFERRLEAAMDSMNTAMESKDAEVTLRMLRCFANSSAFEQAVKEKTEQDKRSPAAKPTSSIPVTDMDDLRLDISGLGGRKVRVRGVGFYMMDMFMLKKSATDMSPFMIDTSRLPREDRRQIIQQCGDIMSGCRVTVYGTVGKVNFQNGIVAEKVEW